MKQPGNKSGYPIPILEPTSLIRSLLKCKSWQADTNGRAFLLLITPFFNSVNNFVCASKHVSQICCTTASCERFADVDYKQLHATTFTTKLMTLGLVVKLDEKKNIGAHRSPAYYKLADAVYEKALREGLVLV